jgi:putative ABC transport system permease protein
MKPHLWLIKFVGIIVPKRLRSEWKQEWQSELQYREMLLAEWEKLSLRKRFDLIRRSTGAFFDALWLQRLRLEDEMFQDLRYGVRMLVKKPGFTLVAVVTLALGIGANTSIFSLVNGVLLQPLPYAKSEEIVRLFESFKARDLNFENLTAPGFLDWRAQNTVFEDVAAYQPRGFDITGAGEAKRVLGARASSSLFSILRINPAIGRNFTAEEDAFGKNRVALLSDRLWQERFGGSGDVLGRGIALDGIVYSVVGVLPAGIRFPGLVDADVWVPMAFEPFELENRGGHNYQALARLKQGVSVAQAQSEMDAVASRLGEQYDISKGWGATVVSMQEQVVGDVRKPLFVLLGAVGLVLLIACANVANLLLVRAVSREREFAVRAALGAGRGRIVRQLLFESALLATVGAVLGWLFSSWTVDAVVKFGQSTFPRLNEVRLNAQVLGFTVALTFLTGLFFGLAPAWFVSRPTLSTVLNDGARGITQGRRHRFRTALVVLQVALAVVLLVGSSLLLRSFARLREVDLGFQPEGLLTATLTMPDQRFPERDTQRMAFLERVLDRISALPGVESAGSVMGLPMTFLRVGSAFYFEGKPMPEFDRMPAADYSQISANYFQTMKMPMVRGRSFDVHDTVNAPFVAIVNEAFVRKFCEGLQPLGKRIRVMDSRRDRSTEIVGVVRDVQQGDLTSPAEPMMYFPSNQRCWADAQIVVRTTGDPAALKTALISAVTEVDSAQTLYQINTFDELLGNVLAQRRLQMTLLSVFAGLALLLSAVGIYGVMAYSVTQRSHEIGVRLALGAQRYQVLVLILRQGLGVSLLGIAIGLGGAFALTRLLGSLLFEVTPTDPFSFAVIPLVLGGVALVACWLPAERAARFDPLESLRR